MRMMMTAALAAAALTFAAPAPAAAQVVPVSEAQLEAANRNLQAAMSANDRTMALIQGLDTTALNQATSIDQYVDALDALMPKVEAARTELRQLAGRLEAMPAVAGPGDPVQVHATDAMVDDIARIARQAEAMLATYPEVAAAFRSGDETRMRRSLTALAGASVTLIDGQSLMFRGRVALVPSDRSEYAQGMAMACMYDGLGAALRVQVEMSTAADGARKVAAASACVKEQVSAGRQALARERATPNPTGSLRALESRLADISEGIFNQQEQVALILTQAEASLRGSDPGARVQTQIDAFLQVEANLVELGRRQIQAMADQ